MCLNLLRCFFQPGLVTVCAISLVLGLSGCGKKAPLSLPDAQITLTQTHYPANAL
ncbi:hypothetical protein JX580_09970 [Thiomicrospira microaerophila]|uniref:hypothetical protein n=1 Tax=Thiomicrospira microaerophila TaxID=406020 RepID=UPI00200CFAE8|nr:hypothetical protein [Thiomicrospira microaerophila]UQB41979.1 hypothetical protein JX580_09970 [Thiomicrospira microaerophila]